MDNLVASNITSYLTVLDNNRFSIATGFDEGYVRPILSVPTVHLQHYAEMIEKTFRIYDHISTSGYASKKEMIMDVDALMIMKNKKVATEFVRYIIRMINDDYASLWKYMSKYAKDPKCMPIIACIASWKHTNLADYIAEDPAYDDYHVFANSPMTSPKTKMRLLKKDASRSAIVNFIKMIKKWGDEGLRTSIVMRDDGWEFIYHYPRQTFELAFDASLLYTIEIVFHGYLNDDDLEDLYKHVGL